jgi:hypothetical protein
MGVFPLFFFLFFFFFVSLLWLFLLFFSFNLLVLSLSLLSVFSPCLFPLRSLFLFCSPLSQKKPPFFIFGSPPVFIGGRGRGPPYPVQAQGIVVGHGSSVSSIMVAGYGLCQGRE